MRVCSDFLGRMTMEGRSPLRGGEAVLTDVWMPKYRVVVEGKFLPKDLALAIELRAVEINPEMCLGSTSRKMQMIAGESARGPYHTPYRSGRAIR